MAAATTSLAGKKSTLALSATLAFGLAAGAGTLRIFPAADVALALGALAIAVYYRHRMPRMAWLVCGPLLLGCLWTPDLMEGAWLALRVTALLYVASWLLKTGAEPQLLAAGFAGGVLLQTMALPAVAFESRHAGLSINAFTLSMTGLYAWMLMPLAGRYRWFLYLTALLSLATPTTRTPLAAGAVFAVTGVRRALLYTVIIGAAYLCAWQSGDLYRLLPGVDAERSLDNRVEILVDPESHIAYRDVHAAYGDRFEPEPVQLRLFGYGTGGYLASTAAQRPHNVLVLGAYELGLLAAPVFGAAGWFLWRRRRDLWPLFVPLGLVMMLSEEIWSRPDGHWSVALLLVAVLSRPAFGELKELAEAA